MRSGRSHLDVIGLWTTVEAFKELSILTVAIWLLLHLVNSCILWRINSKLLAFPFKFPPNSSLETTFSINLPAAPRVTRCTSTSILKRSRKTGLSFHLTLNLIPFFTDTQGGFPMSHWASGSSTVVDEKIEIYLNNTPPQPQTTRAAWLPLA